MKPIADEILEQHAADPVFAPMNTYVPPVGLFQHAARNLGETHTPRGGRS